MPTSATKCSVSEALELALREEREPLCFGASEIVVTKDRSPTYEYLGPEVTHVITHRNEATCNLKAFAFPLSMHHQSDCCSARAPFGAGTACACYRDGPQWP